MGKMKATFEERHLPAVDRENAYWRIPTAHWLKLDKARLAHWKAVLKKGNTTKTLAAWAKLLHIPRK